MLQSTLDAAVITARQWTVDVLRGQSETKASFADRNKLVADIVMLETRCSRMRCSTPRNHPCRRKGGPPAAGSADEAPIGTDRSSTTG